MESKPEIDHLKWTDVQEMYNGYIRASNDIDADVATNSSCPKCGRKMSFAGFRQKDSYIAVAYCVACNYAEEF